MNGKLVRRIHVSWHVAAACAGIVVGVASIQAIDGTNFASIGWLLIGVAGIVFTCIHSRTWMIILAVGGGMLIGLWRGSITVDDSVRFKSIIGNEAALTGVVSEDVDVNEREHLVIRLRDVTIGDVRTESSVWLTANINADIRRSDVITIEGKLSDGFGSFAASIYQANVTSVQREENRDVALEVRDWFAGGVTTAITEPEASLGLGYLVGQRRGLPEELDTALQAAGLTHIVVASGYNLTILVRLARRLFERVSKYLSFIVSLGMIASFIAITGLSPSMSRAGLVAGLSLLAWYYGRRFHPLVLLPFAMAITVLVQPSYAWGDLGWQLSFAAFAGVMILAPLLQAYFFGDKPERPIRRIFIETIAATIATLPILLVSFGQLSVVAPLANMLILPFVPLAMLLTFSAGIVGLAAPTVAHIAGFPAELLLGYMVTTARFMGELPWAVQEIDAQPIFLVVAFSVIVGATVYMKRATGYDLRTSSLVE